MPSSESKRRSSGRRMNIFEVGGVLAALVGVATVMGIFVAGLVLPVAVTATQVTEGATQIFEDLPADLNPGELSQASYIYASDGVTLLATYYSENRIVVSLDNISPYLQQAVIATEDRRFYEHGAIDIIGIPRALVNNQLGRATQGASTLTQQYVKNVLIERAHAAGDAEGVAAAREESYARKLREMKLAISLEQSYSKDEILQGYLNIAQFGSSVYGVETAAQHYFGVSAKDVTLAQAATIAGITKAPNALDPILHPEAAQDRRDTVLGLMLQEGYITQEEHDAAVATPIADTLNVKNVSQGCVAAAEAAFFCDYVTQVITSDPVFGETEEEREALLLRGGLRIVTTIDLDAQRQATSTLKASMPVDNEYGFAMALAAVEPGTGKIRVLAQNRDYDASSEPAPLTTAINYSVGEALGGGIGAQPGSTFKPFVLTEWLRTGHTLSETVNASRTRWNVSDFTASCMQLSSEEWPVQNSEGVGYGQISVLRATAQSINTAYVAMENQLDLCSIANTAKEVGFTPASATNTDVSISPSMVLGVQNTSPLGQASAYATFASGGIHCDPIALESVTDADGTPLPVPQASCRRTLPANIANTVTYALEGVLSSGGGAYASALSNDRPAAGKTGTTDNSTATWFVGYTPQLSTAVWVGAPEGLVPQRKVTINGVYYPNVYGSSIAAPAWKTFMDSTLASQPAEDFGAPDPALVGETRQTTSAPAASAAPSQAATPAPQEGGENNG